MFHSIGMTSFTCIQNRRVKPIAYSKFHCAKSTRNWGTTIGKMFDRRLCHTIRSDWNLTDS